MGLGVCSMAVSRLGVATIAAPLSFADDLTPTPPTLSASVSDLQPGDTVTLSGTKWRGSPLFGSASSPTNPGETALVLEICGLGGNAGRCSSNTGTGSVDLLRYKDTDSNPNAFDGNLSGVTLGGSIPVGPDVAEDCASNDCFVRVRQQVFGAPPGTFLEATAPLQIDPSTAPGLLRVATDPPLPSQISVDGIPRDTWGLTWTKMAPGPHEVCFSAIEGFTTPPCQTVSVAAATTTAVTGAFARRGFLKAETSPALPATITVDGVARDTWGLYTDLPAGPHQVCYGPVADHSVSSPACKDVVISAGGTTTVVGTYTSSPGAPEPAPGDGFLRVTTNPAVRSQISVDGHPRNTWALNAVRLSPGDHQVCFADIEGFTTPACQTVNITEGATATVEGAFAQRGFLKAETSPALPATISVDGTPKNDWGVYTHLPVGDHQVCYGPVPGYTTPPCRNVTLSATVVTTTVGTYEPG